MTRYPARGGRTLVLGHGAGAGQKSPFMVAFAKAMQRRGVTAVTFDFPYMAAGRRMPDRAPVLEAAFRDVIVEVGRVRRLFIGGKSMGGRIASQLAAQHDLGLAGLVFLGYPLHPPGQPKKLRSAHLAGVKAPMLFVQGTRDPFGTPDELAKVLPPRGEIFVVDGGDHSFRVARGAGDVMERLMERIEDEVARWVKAAAAG